MARDVKSKYGAAFSNHLHEGCGGTAKLILRTRNRESGVITFGLRGSVGSSSVSARPMARFVVYVYWGVAVWWGSPRLL